MKKNVCFLSIKSDAAGQSVARVNVKSSSTKWNDAQYAE